jgi:hypothetical protein
MHSLNGSHKEDLDPTLNATTTASISCNSTISSQRGLDPAQEVFQPNPSQQGLNIDNSASQRLAERSRLNYDNKIRFCQKALGTLVKR